MCFVGTNALVEFKNVCLYSLSIYQFKHVFCEYLYSKLGPV